MVVPGSTSATLSIIYTRHRPLRCHCCPPPTTTATLSAPKSIAVLPSSASAPPPTAMECVSPPGLAAPPVPANNKDNGSSAIAIGAVANALDSRALGPTAAASKRCINPYSIVYSVYIRGPPIQKFGDGTDFKAGTTKERLRGRGPRGRESMLHVDGP
jgi:hypothetical protein